MNESEKKVFETLSNKEKEEVAGGITLDANVNLTDEQCKKLRAFECAMSQLDNPILVKYGGPDMFQPNLPTTLSEKINQLREKQSGTPKNDEANTNKE